VQVSFNFLSFFWFQVELKNETGTFTVLGYSINETTLSCTSWDFF